MYIDMNGVRQQMTPTGPKPVDLPRENVVEEIVQTALSKFNPLQKAGCHTNECVSCKFRKENGSC